MLRDYSLLGRHIKSPGRNIARPGRISALSWLGRNLSIRLGRHPLPGGPHHPCSPSWPGGPLPFPAWAEASHPAGPRLPAPAWAATPAGPQAACPGWGVLPAGPPSLAPPMGRPLRSTRLGRIRRIRPGRDSSPGRHLHHARLGWIRRIRPGRDFSPSGHHMGTVPAGLGRDSPGPGRIIPLQADLVLSGPKFTSSGTYSSSGIDSSVLCQSWDALWLRLAHTPSLCWSWDAPWLRPAYSSSIVVSLILRRRIRLMTRRS
jgi:hypothetical protein